MNPRTYFSAMEFFTGVSSMLHFKGALQIEAAELHRSCLLMSLRAKLDQCSPERAVVHTTRDRLLGMVCGLSLTLPLIIMLYVLLAHPAYQHLTTARWLVAGLLLFVPISSHLAQTVMRRRLREFAQKLQSNPRGPL